MLAIVYQPEFTMYTMCIASSVVIRSGSHTIQMNYLLRLTYLPFSRFWIPIVSSYLSKFVRYSIGYLHTDTDESNSTILILLTLQVPK